MAETIYILMGSNIGDREKNLIAARTKLEAMEGFEIVAVSGVYISEAKGMGKDIPAMMNQVVMADYQYSPNELLGTLELIEKNLGRTGKGQKLPRTIDLDILLFGNQIIETERLSVPHRELLNRPFAMVPLLEVEPNIIHPVTKKPVAEFLSSEASREVLLYKDHVARQP